MIPQGSDAHGGGAKIIPHTRRTPISDRSATSPSPKPLSPRNDVERGDLLADAMVAASSHRWCYEEEGWLAWTGTHWSLDRHATADALAVQLAKSYRVPRDGGHGRTKWVPDDRAQSDAAIRAALRRASCQARLRVVVSQLDAHPYLLATPAGTVELDSGELRPADPADLLTRCTAIGMDMSTPTPTWDGYLRDVTGHDPDLAAYLQRVAGMALCGEVLDHLLVVVYGPSRSGKSTFLQVLEGLLGGELTATVPASILAARRQMYDTERRYMQAELRGRRLVTSYESEEGGTLDEASVKVLTSSDPVTARQVYGRPFSFRPSHTLLLATNEKPTVASNDDAVWNRLALVPFEHPRPPAHQDRHFVRRLLATEGPGILAWAVRGAVAYLADGLGSCAAVDAATTDYRSEQDIVGQFVADCLIVQPEAKVPQPALTTAWEQWCAQQHLRAWTLRALKRRLTDRGLIGPDAEHRTGTTRWLRGIGLQAIADERF